MGVYLLKNTKLSWLLPVTMLVLLGIIAVLEILSSVTALPKMSRVDAYVRTQAAKMASLAGQKARIEQQLAVTADATIRWNLKAHLRVIQSEYAAPFDLDIGVITPSSDP